MANWTGYFGIENIALNTAQKLILWDVLKTLGSPSQPLPNLQMQVRIRPDADAVIFEAEFRRDTLSVEWFSNGLAAIFNMPAGNVTSNLVDVVFADRVTPVVAFGYNGIPMLRMALFGGINATWRESWVECTAYLARNRDLWESLAK